MEMTAVPRLTVVILPGLGALGGPADSAEVQAALREGGTVAGTIVAEPRPGDATIFRAVPQGEGEERRKNFLALRTYFTRRVTEWRAQGLQIKIADPIEHN